MGSPGRRGTGRRLAAAACLLAACALLAGCGSSASRSSSKPSAGLPSTAHLFRVPTQDQLVERTPLSVVLRTPGGARPARARLNGAEVTGLFHRAADGTWTASVPNGSPLQTGPNVLWAQAGRTVDSVRFILGRRSPPVVDVTGLPAPGAGPKLVTARVQPNATFHVAVNGVPVDGAFAQTGMSARRGTLGANDGLRFGRNRVEVVAYDQGTGAYDREAHTITVPRSRPLAGAGPDQRLTVGNTVALSGRSSRAAAAGTTLAYRWTVVRAPRRSHARVADASAAAASLHPDVNGTYRVRLTVTESARGRRPTTSSDVVTLAVAPYVPPVGAPIDTVANVTDGGIRVEGIGPKSLYAEGSLSLLVLNRQTLEVEQELGTHVGAAGFASVADAVAKVGPDSLVIISGTDLNGPESDLNLERLNAIAAKIGGAPFSEIASGTQAWSIVGVPGWPKGTATENDGQDPGGSRYEGDLSGYLQESPGTGQYELVQSDSEFFDTDVPGQPDGRNRMQIGDHTYDSDALARGQAGFHVVTVRRSSLALSSNRTFATNTGDAARDVGAVQAAAKLIAGTHPDDLVFVQSIGQPGYAGRREWADLAAAIEKLGGTRTVVNTLNVGQTGDQRGGYAVVGGPAVPGPAAEATHDKASAQLGRLTGMLTRDDRAGFRPVFDAPSSGRYTVDFQQLLYQPPRTWPASDTPEKRAANAYIAHALGYGDETDVRRNYVNDNLDWDAEKGRLEDVGYPVGTKTFTAADFDAVKSALLKEFPMVQTVKKGLIPSFQEPFKRSVLGSEQVLQTLSDQLAAKINAKTDQDAQLEALGIIQQILSMGAALQPETEAGIEAAKWIGRAASAVGAAGQGVAYFGGGPQPILTRFKAKVNDLAHQLVDRYNHALQGLDLAGDIFVTDWGKLQAASARAKKEWKSDTNVKAAAQRGLDLAAKRTFYAALLPIPYETFREPGVESARNCRFFYYWWDRLYTDTTPGAEQQFVDGYTNDAPPNRELFNWSMTTRGPNTRGSDRDPPPASLVDPLWKPVRADDPNALGLYKPYFFSQNLRPTHRDINCGEHP